MMLNTPQCIGQLRTTRNCLIVPRMRNSALDLIFVHTKNVDFHIQQSIQHLVTANYLKAFVPPSLSAQQFMCDSSQKH